MHVLYSITLVNTTMKQSVKTKPLQQLTMIESSSLHLKLITSGLTVMKLEANELEPCSPGSLIHNNL